MKFALILAALKSVADVIKSWFSWMANKREDGRDAVDKTASSIGKGKPFIILLLLLFVGCMGYVYTVSTPMAFDPDDFQYLEAAQDFNVPKDGYYFSNEAMEKYIRAKIAEYEMRKRGFFHKDK